VVDFVDPEVDERLAEGGGAGSGGAKDENFHGNNAEMDYRELRIR
jgi:hypothetical protein